MTLKSPSRDARTLNRVKTMRAVFSAPLLGMAFGFGHLRSSRQRKPNI